MSTNLVELSNIAVHQTESKGSDVAISQPLITFGQSGAGRSSHKGFLCGLKVTSGLPALTSSMYSFSEHAKTDEEDSKQIHGSNTSHCLRSSQTPSQCSPVLATAEGVLLGKAGARLFWLGQLFTGFIFPNSNIQDAMLAASQTSCLCVPSAANSAGIRWFLPGGSSPRNG